MDYTLLLIVVLLVVIGLVILYSTSAYNGQVKFHDSFYYLKKQAFATVLGIVLMLFVAGMDYHIWQRLAIFGLAAAVALSVAVMLFGREINGSKRWLALGPFSFQPSEFAKVALILFLADLVTKNVKTIGKMWTLCRIMFWILPIVGLGGSEQFKHGDHYSGNRCDPDLCSKPEICAVCLDGTRRRVLYGAFSCP